MKPTPPKRQDDDRYRTRYLQLKSALYDRTTGLPAFPVLFGQLRTWLDQRRHVGVVHFEIANLDMVESLYGWQVFDRIVSRVSRTLRQEVGSILPETALVALNGVAGDRFVVFVADTPAGKEVDASFLAPLGQAVIDRLETAFEGDDFAGLSPRLCFRNGHALLSENPFYRFERCVYSAVEEARGFHDRRERRRELSWSEELQRIIHDAELRPVFQPVVDLNSRELLGYEAFVRGPEDTLFETPRVLFDLSDRVGVAGDLDLVCSEAALNAFARIDDGRKIFLNVLPGSFSDRSWRCERLPALLESLNLASPNLVLEISEREADLDPGPFLESISDFKSEGFRLALDDVGTGRAGLEAIEKMQPDYLKLDLSLVRNIDESLIKQEILLTLVGLAGRIGAAVIAEGVETDAEAAALTAAGAHYGQGFLYGSPVDPGRLPGKTRAPPERMKMFPVDATSLLALALAAAVALLLTLWISWRRRTRRDVRQIVQRLEELRSGHAPRPTDLGGASDLALVSDAISRLGHDFQVRWNEAESAAERWRALTDAAQDTAVVTTDTDGDIRSFSPGATSLLGWTEDEVLSRPAAVLFEEDSYKELLPKLARRSLRVQGVTTRSTLTRQDGEAFPAEVGVRMLLGSSGEPVGFMMVIRDITQQLDMESDLRASEGRYRGLVEQLAEAVVIVRAGKLAFVNSAAERLFGHPAQELLGTPMRDRVATGDVLLVESRLAEIAGGAASAELHCEVNADGGATARETRIKASLIAFDGEPAVLLLIQDETTERRAESEMQFDTARLDAVLETTSDGILVFTDDEAGSIVQITNQAFLNLFELAEGQVLGATRDGLARLMGERPGGSAEVAAIVAEPGARAGRRMVHLEGSTASEVQVTVAPLLGRGGESLGGVIAFRDLTLQRSSERQLQAQAEQLQLSKLELEQAYRQLTEVNAQLERRGDELDRLNQELRRLDEMKSNLLGNVSHELQTPLVSIRGYTEMILKERLGPISDEQRKGLQLSLTNIDRLIAMIDNLLAFTRPDAGPTELSLTRFALHPMIQEATDLLRERMEEKGIELAIEFDEDDFWLLADRDKILQVFINVISNAVKHSFRRGKIEVVARRGRPGYLTVEVVDHGSGIPAESLGKIFERHYQVRRVGEGSGIGLSIVRDVLRLHGCRIRAESDEGQGARFVFDLPTVAEAAPAPQEREPRPGPGSAPEPAPEPEAAPEDHPAPDRAETERPARAGKPRLRIIRRYKSGSG